MVPFLHVTTKIEGRLNDNLLAEIGGKGFPSMRFMDGDGNVLGAPSGYQVAAFESRLVQIQNIQQLEQRIDAGEEDLNDDLFLAKLRMGVIPYVFAKAKAATFDDFTKVEAAEVAQLLLDLEVKSLLRNRRTPVGKHEATQRFLEMIETDLLPGKDALGEVWRHLNSVADRAEDIALFERSLLGMKEVIGVDGKTKAFFDAQDLRLKEMRDKAVSHD